MSLRVITPVEIVFEGDVDSVTLPTADGEITVLPHHVPVITTITPGPMIVRRGNDEQVFAISRGVIEVNQMSVQVLSDIADRAEGLEEATAEKARQEAEELMKGKREDAVSFAEATAIFERELARLKTVRRHRSKRGFTAPPSNAA